MISEEGNKIEYTDKTYKKKGAIQTVLTMEKSYGRDTPLPNGWQYQAAKRAFDVAAASALLVVLSPLLLMIAILIKHQDKNASVFHTRACVGKDNRPYEMYKFRTMVPDADNLKRWLTPEQITEYLQDCKLENDPRITKIGKLLRKTSMDELPQLLCVLKNDMSLIGPRPVTEREAAAYGNQRSLLLHVKPGITGWWQVKCRSSCSYLCEEAKNLQLYYAENCSVGLDLKILMLTFRAVTNGKDVI